MRFLLAILLLGCLAVSCLALSHEELQFQEFLSTYGKTYSGREYFTRLEIFKNNLKVAAELQARSPKAEFGVTKFSDLTADEFRQRFLNTNLTRHSRDPAHKWNADAVADVEAYPSSWNWGNQGALTPVYNQEQCGSCWSFSTAESIESQWKIAGHPLVKLSMQQLIDCDKVDQGCNGGNPVNAYKYVINYGGLDTYASYPYTEVRGTCKASTANIGAKIRSWQYITENDNEAAMQKFTYTTGPPSVCVDATIWQTYRSGVITASSGCGRTLDHAVQLVGWNTIGGTVAWVVRNSWGADWGNAGFIYLEYGYDVCGIGQEVTAAIV
jgi:cathepsin F